MIVRFKVCKMCGVIYSVIPHKCPKCGCYDYEIKEVDPCGVNTIKEGYTEVRSENAKEEDADT